ncbi:hypothetical protein [Cupriavidus basilensis]|uniref:hypothetical protein n=1 Tax=Cupriavidus basilensis TaxID=68895 RepID=UPI0020A64FDF|nr:hypothetical protein [Cupriavidus basilensis]MCP3022276.1 hypothetical protein [Cupriavidus basilensis]
MQKDTTPLGQVGLPTSNTIANALPDFKAGGVNATPLYFDSIGDKGDDFDDMVVNGLAPATATQLRRLAHGMAGIREITNLLYLFNVERDMRDDADEEEKDRFQILSPRAAEGVARGVRVLADLLHGDIYSLGNALAQQASKGGAQ